MDFLIASEIEQIEMCNSEQSVIELPYEEEFDDGTGDERMLLPHDVRSSEGIS